MSTPRSLELPPCAVPTRVGDLAAIIATPAQATRTTVVMVPGYTGSKEDFLPLLPQLTDGGHQVIAYDQRGQHESTGDENPTSYGIEALAGDLLDVIGTEPAHVVGHSFGGLVARSAAIREPGRFRSLTLLDSGPAALPGIRAMRIEALRPVLVERGKEGVWEYVGTDDLDPDIAAFAHRRFHANSATGLLVMGDALLVEPDRTAELGATRIPILVAHGERDDAWTPEMQAAMAHRLGAQHVVIAGAAHSPAVEAAGATARVLLEFWGSVEAEPLD